MSTFDRWNALAGVLNESTEFQRVHEITTGSISAPDEAITHEERISDERAEFNKDGLMKGDPFVYEYQATPFPAFRVVALTAKGEASPKRSSYSKAVQRGTVFKMGSPAFTALHDRFKKFGYKLQGVDKMPEPVGEPTQGDRPEKKSASLNDTQLENIVDQLVQLLTDTEAIGASGPNPFNSPSRINKILNLLQGLSDSDLYNVRIAYNNHRDRPGQGYHKSNTIQSDLYSYMGWLMRRTLPGRPVHRESDLLSITKRIGAAKRREFAPMTLKPLDPVTEGSTKQNYNLLSEGKDMSTFDRWNKMAGLLNESAEPQQTVEAEETQASTMNESDLRGMIAELAKGMLTERRATNYQVQIIQNALKAINAGESEIKDSSLTDQFSDLFPDGKFGRKTKDQVEIFQKIVGLKDDGIVGPDTLRALIRVLDDGSQGARAHVYGLDRMVNQGVIARQGHGFDGKKGSKQAAPDPAAPGQKPSLNRVLKNLVRRIGTEIEDVDEKSVKSAMIAKMKSDPAFATNVRDLSKMSDKEMRSSRLMRQISQPVMVALGTSGSDTMVASGHSDKYIRDLMAYIETLPEDPSYEEIAAAKGEEAARALVGEPAPGDEPIDADVVMPGMKTDEKGAFIRGITFTNVYGDKIMSLPKSDYEAARSPDLDLVARANKVKKVTLY